MFWGTFFCGDGFNKGSQKKGNGEFFWWKAMGDF
jgi:hypothetical protein